MKVPKTEILEKVKNLIEKAGYRFVKSGCENKSKEEKLHLGFQSSLINPFEITLGQNHLRVTFSEKDTKRFTNLDEMLSYIEKQIENRKED